jgi:type II secretion system protein H
MLNRNLRSYGFTLIEVVIVIFIMLLMTTVTVPSLKMFADSTKLRTAARSINGLLEFARGSAITERTEYAVLFDPTNGQYWLSLKEFLDESQGTLTDSSRTNLAASLEALAEKNANSNTGTSNTSSTSDNSTAPLTRTGGLLGIPRDLPVGVEIVQINSFRNTSKSSDVDYVTFYPDSKAEDFEVYLQSASGKTFLISVSESTGRTGIRELTSEEIEQLGLVANTTK